MGWQIMKTFEMKGRKIVEGVVEGEALVTSEPISFMGSINPKTGYVIEKGHDIEGAWLKDKILVFPCSKGSTGGSYMLYDVVKNGVGPRGIINIEAESIVVIGAIVAKLPMVDKIDISKIKTGDYIYLDATNGIVKVQRKDD
jgi:predicted aconitase with swiveling domain